MKIIKNEYILSQEFVPGHILARDDEMNKLEYLLFGNENSSTVIIEGNPGTGKTLLAKRMMNSRKEYDSKYINCYTFHNERSIIAEIIGKSEAKAEINSLTNEKAIELMLSSFKSDKNLIVLDEAHSLRKKDSSFLYALTRSNELDGPPIKLLLATIEDPELFLDKSTLSGLGRFNRIYLRKYNADDLFQIVKDRAESALYDGGYDDASLRAVAELSEDNGSARVAIELLNNSVLTAENLGSQLTSEIVLKTYREFSPPIDDSSLTALDIDELKLINELLNFSKESRFYVADVRSIMDDKSGSKAYKFLNRLENIGLIKKSRLSRGYKTGVQNEYLFKIPPDVLREKIDSMISNYKE